MQELKIKENIKQIDELISSLELSIEGLKSYKSFLEILETQMSAFTLPLQIMKAWNPLN